MPHEESLSPRSALSRRHFAAIGAATLAAAHGLQGRAQGAEATGGSPLKPGITLLFQGDSITDAGRSREAAGEANSQPALGNGYAWLAASQLLVDRPGDGIKIFNRGISGNKVPNLDERWQADCVDLKPNVLSILIGVNDIWRTFDRGEKGTAEIYEEGYHALIKKTKAALPDTTLVICEPFVLKCGAVTDAWFPKFDGYRTAAKRVAEQAGAIFVPFQTMFDEASKIAPPERWAGDGVHPSADGAALMAHTWRRVVDGGGV
ncbi:SGNH/GDSL hydrolase family protein [Lacipirellula parvula]|uniref:Lipase/acylhydrolase family protein n=1 Tax=Lacipirellula parvula TaxID=2650471 RepID=A0A5K7X9B7_9BACT|nr:SGNH/GDSL hydrolase family protein [Lacipirellula parvula]BBO31003.1 lipase/acylhydrolase family protein [Lacipirellula parvula]